MVYPRYNQLFPSLRVVRDSLERGYFARQAEVEKEAMRLYGQAPEQAVEYLNDYSVEQAQDMLACWKDLAVHLIVKYNDMVVKPEANGKFIRNAEGLGETPERPGYTEKFAREIIRQTGDKYVYPAK